MRQSICSSDVITFKGGEYTESKMQHGKHTVLQMSALQPQESIRLCKQLLVPLQVKRLSLGTSCCHDYDLYLVALQQHPEPSICCHPKRQEGHQACHTLINMRQLSWQACIHKRSQAFKIAAKSQAQDVTT